MEKVRSRTKVPSTSDGIKTQEEADRLVEEETTMRKEVELFLQEELDKLLAEKETIKESEELLRKASQEFKLSEKSRAPSKKSKASLEQPPKLEKTGVEEDLLSLLNEPWDPPRDPTTGELEDQWDKLSLLDESMLDLKPLAKQRGFSRPEEDDTILEEEEKEDRGQSLEKKEDQLVQMPSRGAQHLVIDYHEEEGSLKEGSKHSLWSMRSGIGAMLDQKLQGMQGLKDSIQRKSISTLPLGYFTKAKHLSSSEVAEKEEHPSDEPEPRSWISRFLRRPKPKKAGGFRKKFFKKSQPGGAQVTDLTKIFNEDFYKSQDQRISDDIADEELSPSPEDIPQQEEAKQIQREIKKKEDASSGSMWYMGQGSGYRGMGHAREFSESIFKDKQYRQRFAKHERDSKVSVPLPLQELIEEEVLAILKATLLSYQKKLGVNHPLTKQMEEQVDKIHLQLQGRGFI